MPAGSRTASPLASGTIRNPGLLPALSFTLARSRAIDRLRANRARKAPPGEQPASEPVPDPAVELHQVQRARIVRTALAGLDTNERAALQLAYFSDLSQSEVAEKLGIPLGTVKTRMRSALMKLRETLSGRRE